MKLDVQSYSLFTNRKIVDCALIPLMRFPKFPSQTLISHQHLADVLPLILSVNLPTDKGWKTDKKYVHYLLIYVILFDLSVVIHISNILKSSPKGEGSSPHKG